MARLIIMMFLLTISSNHAEERFPINEQEFKAVIKSLYEIEKYNIEMQKVVLNANSNICVDLLNIDSKTIFCLENGVYKIRHPNGKVDQIPKIKEPLSPKKTTIIYE